MSYIPPVHQIINTPHHHGHEVEIKEDGREDVGELRGGEELKGGGSGDGLGDLLGGLPEFLQPIEQR